ncbi:hypothetical protein E4U55_001803 [Claviceps digitariae]|nr:hypothetical protein E4U55_001803 [Claviceps digitariae]
MEARSLSAIFDLAEHPPQYPEAPASKIQESLVLYISRVPGKRGRYSSHTCLLYCPNHLFPDVILSTVKPQERNVTGEDVANSLYYIHLESPARDSSNVESTNCDIDSGPRPLTIPRKPVPNQSRALSPPPQLVVSADPSPTTIESLNAADGSFREPRLSGDDPDATLISTDQREATSNTRAVHVHERTPTGLHTKIPARKPVGRRPMSVAYTADTNPTIAPPTISSNLLIRPMDHLVARDNNAEGLRQPTNGQRPVLRLETPTPQHGGVGSSLAKSSWSPSRASDHTASRSPSPRKLNNTYSTNANGTPFSLRIIRRNPSSGFQRNVARVSSRQLETVENGDEQDLASVLGWGPPTTLSLHPHPSINVEIETSGYFIFRVQSRKANHRRTLRDEHVMLSRQLLMVYTQSFTKKLQKTYQRLEQTTLNRLNRYRSNSVGSVVSNGSDMSDDIDEIATDGPPPPGTKPRGYAFSSPWGGKCNFQTGQTGRNLICRHRPQDYGTNYNPLVADQNSKKLASAERMVSDLRFNLPVSEILAERGEQWKGNFGKFRKPGAGAQGQGHDDGDEHGDGAASPFRLSLGAERAGGGSRGRNAKLGKLIVYDEGLKMLDLVVAANMGIWWRAWEKNF